MISFDSIPTGSLVPFVFAEFDNSQAIQGSSKKVIKALLFGQAYGGSAPANVPFRATSPEEVAAKTGIGSILHRMALSHFANNTFTETWFVPLADPTGGVAAAGALAISGTAIKSGSIPIYIGYDRFDIPVAAGETGAGIVGDIVSPLNMALDLPVTASAGGTGEVVLAAKNTGELGNTIPLRIGYFDGEELPEGINVVVTPMADGAGVPSISDAIAALGDDQYDFIAFPYTQSALLEELETELESRWGPLRQNDGTAISWRDGSVSDLMTFADDRNSPHLSVPGWYKSQTPGFEWAAAIEAVAAYYSPIDPAMPFQTLPVARVRPPRREDLFRMEERDLLLKDGISTLNVDSGGVVRFERLVTTYKKNAQGSPDPSYRDVPTMKTLSFYRWDFRTDFQRRFPRYKLGDDSKNYGPGQKIMTPLLGKAFANTKFEEWEEAGLVENAQYFSDNLIVERVGDNPNMLGFFMTPDVMNMLVSAAAKFAFKL